jgi:hypothetical protein
MVRAASLILDRAFNTLDEAGKSDAINSTDLRFGSHSLTVTPRIKHRDVVFEAMVEEFRKGGWGYHSQTDPATGSRESMSFDHPSTLTQTGDRLGATRLPTLQINIPLPPSEVPLTASRIADTVQEAGEVAHAVLNDLWLREDPRAALAASEAVQYAAARQDPDPLETQLFPAVSTEWTMSDEAATKLFPPLPPLQTAVPQPLHTSPLNEEDNTDGE